MQRRTFLGAGAGAIALGATGLWSAPARAETTVPEMVIGSADAKVTVIEYGSYTCSHCATFAERVWKPLKAEYIDTGKVRFIFREVYFDRYGLWAAMVARCGGEMRYFGIQEMLFAQQQDWAGRSDPTDVVAALRKIGRTAGLGDEQLDACLNDGAMAEAMVAKYQADTKADGIEATPTLMINGKKHSNMAYADLAKLIEAELAD